MSWRRWGMARLGGVLAGLGVVLLLLWSGVWGDGDAFGGPVLELVGGLVLLAAGVTMMARAVGGR